MEKFFATKIDISNTAHQQWIYRGAIESLFKKFLSVRIGAVWIQKDQKSLLSGGIAFQSPKLLLEYGLETDQKNYQQAFTILLRI